MVVAPALIDSDAKWYPPTDISDIGRSPCELTITAMSVGTNPTRTYSFGPSLRGNAAAAVVCERYTHFDPKPLQQGGLLLRGVDMKDE